MADKVFSGQHAVVTGGSRGIGAAIAETLARHGAQVTIMGRNIDTLNARARELSSSSGGDVVGCAVDLADPASIDRAFDNLNGDFAAPSILVNNAGLALSAPFSKTDLDFWNKIFAVDLTGAFLCIRKVLPAMREAGHGRIVNIASTAGMKGYPYVTAYCAAKHGLIGLTRSLALETAHKGITVNSVCPGYTDTDIVRDTIANIVAKTGRSQDEALSELVKHNPQGRLIQPAEVAEAVVWLCRPESASVTGQSIAVAGGEIM